MNGRTCSPSHSKWPSNWLPVHWLVPRVCRGAVAVGARYASLALVPVPQGERVEVSVVAHHEVAVVGVGVGEQFDMVDQRAVFTVDALGFEG